VGPHRALRSPAGRLAMILYTVGGVLAVVLLVYLFVALLRPELF
jgi:K+-transporting ATPase KdpF subunit